jgi:hypothetical protein
VIRNVVVGRLRPAEDPAQQAADAALLQEGLAGIAALSFPGMLATNVGTDLGMREGGWNFAITNDWEDADAYHVYDQDEEHNRLRREIFAQICQDIARVQFPARPLRAWSAESSAGLGVRRPDGYQKAACGRPWPEVTSHAWPARIFTMRLSPSVARAAAERHAS